MYIYIDIYIYIYIHVYLYLYIYIYISTYITPFRVGVQCDPSHRETGPGGEPAGVHHLPWPRLRQVPGGGAVLGGGGARVQRDPPRGSLGYLLQLELHPPGLRPAGTTTYM